MIIRKFNDNQISEINLHTVQEVAVMDQSEHKGCLRPDFRQ
jgi:hypothetical protein